MMKTGFSLQKLAHEAKIRVKKNRTWRARIFLLLDDPESSKKAWVVHKFIIFMVCLSMFAFCAQNTIEFNKYGPHTEACRNEMLDYCDKKTDDWGTPELV